MVPELDAMLPVAAARAEALDAAGAAEAAREEADAALARLAPALALLDRVERRAGLRGEGSGLLERVQAATEAVAAHEAGHAAHVRDEAALAASLAEASVAGAALSRLGAERDGWASAWAEAVVAMGLTRDASVEEGSDLAERWAAAGGHLAAEAQARRQLARVAEDEAELARRARALAVRLGLDADADPLAVAATAARLWAANDAARVRREASAVEAEAAAAEARVCELACAETAAALGTLAASASVPCEAASLRDAASRRRAFDAASAEAASLADAATGAGDGLPVAALRAEVGGRGLDAVRAELADVGARLATLDGTLESAVVDERRTAEALDAHHAVRLDAAPVALREAAIADMHDAVGRYVELRLARDLVAEAVRVVREERQVPLVAAAAASFSELTLGEFDGLAADVDGRGEPVVVGVRSGGRGTQAVATMSEGTRDAMFLAFRLAAVASYCANAEPLPMVLDDVLVSFDDRRTEAALEALAELGTTTQVMLFTHHRSVATAAAPLVAAGRASIVELGP